MNLDETQLKGCFLLEPKIFNDNRGWFFESFNQEKFNKAIGAEVCFVQDNESYSTKGVLRGLHYQRGKFAQAKLVRVVKGEILDVVVDLRKNSKTFGKHLSIKLSEKNKKQLFIPRGLAHGFVVLSDKAILNYKCDNFYQQDSEGGIIFNDPTLNINWGVPDNKLIISEKDLDLPQIQDAVL